MSKTISFEAKEPIKFITWLKKFSIIEGSLLIEVNNKNSTFTAKSYNSEKSIVKFSSISFEDAGFKLKNKNDDFIKIGVYNLNHLIKSINQFKDKDFELNIKYEKVEEEFTGTSLLIKDKTLKIKVNCTSLSIFKYISDDLFKKVIVDTNEQAKIDFSLDQIEEINSLSALDKEYKFLEFVLKNNKFYIKGKAFELELGDSSSNNYILSVYKEQFEKIDKENYNLTLGDDKLIFASYDTDTITVLSMVVKDYDKYDEEVENFD